MVRRAPGAAALLAAALIITGCAAPAPVQEASADRPASLTDAQAEALAAMRFRTSTLGVVGVDARIFGGQHGDMGMAGWVDFTRRTGYAVVRPAGASPILIAWDPATVSFLDLRDGDPGTPPMPAPAGDWQTVPLDPESTALTRMLAALLLLSADRPDNPMLLAQNGARYLGTDEVAGAPAAHYSGVALAGEGDGADLSTQYWIGEDGAIARFGIRLAGDALSTAEFPRTAAAPDSLPVPANPTGAAR